MSDERRAIWLVAVSVLVYLAGCVLGRDRDDDLELPTTCRECGERERTYNTFRCPTCHSQMDPDGDHPPLATEYDGGET